MIMRMRHSIIFALVIAGCSGSLKGSLKAGGATGAPAPSPSPAKGGAAPAPVPETEPPTYPEGLVAMVGARPQWFEGPWASDMSQAVRTGGVHVAMVVNSRPVVFMDMGPDGKPKVRKDNVKNGVTPAVASLFGPQERAFLMAGPGPYQVKILCYSREADGSFRLFGGGLRRRSDMGVVTILGMDCRPIVAAVASGS